MPIDAIYDEALRVLRSARERSITLRLLGGMAVRLHCPSALNEPFLRRYVDIDVVGRAKQSKEIKKLFTDLGYAPRDRFNAVHGKTRLVFNDLEHERRVDIFLDRLQMCHELNFENRLEIESYTLSLADLVATKLQVVQMTEREYKDLMCLLLDHSVGTKDDPEVINGSYLARLASDNWGIYMTFRQSIHNLLDSLQDYELGSGDQQVIREHAQEILSMVENAPKSARWKLRAAIGDKVPWYELPEADKEVAK